MAEIELQRIKGCYGGIKGLLSQLPLSETAYSYPASIIKQYNAAVEELTGLTSTDYSRYKITDEDRAESDDICYQAIIVRPKIGSLLLRLEEEYGFKEQAHNIQPAVYISNQNTTSIDIKINFTIENLIANAETAGEKDNLQVINDELKKPDANWDKLKTALGWIVGYSRELSLKVMPIILDYYLKKNG